jgi:hypothetical protein
MATSDRGRSDRFAKRAKCGARGRHIDVRPRDPERTFIPGIVTNDEMSVGIIRKRAEHLGKAEAPCAARSKRRPNCLTFC